LLGTAAVAAGVSVTNPQESIPTLFRQEFPSWFAGVAFAAIVVGALVPAAIMSIAAANLWTRNVYKAFINPDATDQQEATQSKVASLVVKFGALLFVIAMPKEYAINLQLLGGIWILQTLPSIVIGLYTRWFHRYALLIGWAVAMVWGTWKAYRVPTVGKPGSHFGGSAGPLDVFGVHLSDKPVYFGLVALLINLVLAAVLTAVFRALDVTDGEDSTQSRDFVADAGDPRVTMKPEQAAGVTPTR
jgi:SSS family solute:Na+ symporter